MRRSSISHADKPAFEETCGKVWTAKSRTMLSTPGVPSPAWLARNARRCAPMARYLRQLRIPYQPRNDGETFLRIRRCAQQIYALFFAAIDPDLKGNREDTMPRDRKAIMDALAKVEAIEEDRIIRRYINLVQASLRTNYFQTHDTTASRKPIFRSNSTAAAVEFMPLPKPLYEIFVYSPRVEAHPSARRQGRARRHPLVRPARRFPHRNPRPDEGADGEERVIVPVGSKGGFIVKRPPSRTATSSWPKASPAIKIMMRGLLDITDNRQTARSCRRNASCAMTATILIWSSPPTKARPHSPISPTASSQEYGFWLGDAFASGGSAGYDHKEMAITARGAWESVKRHFREMGKDIQTQDFTCVGVGDMSGDVFGNGMLLSKHIRLLARLRSSAYLSRSESRMPATSFAERKRLFNLPRSSWADYDAKMISKGGGIFARTRKDITLIAGSEEGCSASRPTACRRLN